MIAMSPYRRSLWSRSRSRSPRGPRPIAPLEAPLARAARLINEARVLMDAAEDAVSAAAAAAASLVNEAQRLLDAHSEDGGGGGGDGGRK